VTETTPSPSPDATPVIAPPNEGTVPRRFARYEIDKVTGKGAMGWVVLARDLTLQRPVALKLFRVEGDAETQRKVKKRYVDEARAAARLVHPHILQIYEVGLFQGWVYIAMEVLPGGDLKTRVVNYGPLGWFDACKLILQAADGLAYAHQQGMLHRDIKPANLMLTARGDCKVVDFGLTTRIGAAIGEPGAGTPNYQSPESARGHNGPQNDVWGTAATLWFLLVGKPPFELDKPKDVIKIHNGLELPDLRALRPDVPESVVRVIEQALAKQPGERFHLVEDFARVLRVAVEQSIQRGSGAWPGYGPVNPELVELATAAGSMDFSGSQGTPSRLVAASRTHHDDGSTPAWTYVLIAVLLIVALGGTAYMLIDSAGSGGRAGGGAAPLPGSDGTTDSQPSGPLDDGRRDVEADQISIAEQFGAGPGLAEQIAGVGVAVSSTAHGSKPGAAIDGAFDTAWRSDSGGWLDNKLTLDLGEVVLVHSVTIHWGDPLPPEVCIRWSVDGRAPRVFSDWQPVKEAEHRHRPASPVEARYIEITTRNEPDAAPDIVIREVKVIYE
jgi:hypothetical protein